MGKRSGSEVVMRTNNKIAHEAARDVSAAVVGTLMGVALGGVPGAVVGAAASPLVTAAVKIASDVVQRRRRRAEAIVDAAMQNKGLSPAQTLEELETDPEKVDAFVGLIGQVAQSDPSVDVVLAAAAGELLVSEQGIGRERILLVTDAIKGLRATHMRVLSALHRSDGHRTASDLAANVGIPEVELRGVVRELELRGMIKDLNKRPVEWKLRELGQAIMEFAQPRDAERLP